MRRLLRVLLRPVRLLIHAVAMIFVAAVSLAMLAVILLNFVSPPLTYLMVQERQRLGAISRDWVALDEMAPDMARAVIAAEDANFCRHHGFDINAIREALSEEDRRRGASTITQQVAKNVFLWPDASWTRKGLEAGFTILIEAFLPKRRIMELYLNLAEMGEGRFGAEAAARGWYAKSAATLSRSEAARLAAILPSPRTRDPARPSRYLRERSAAIVEGMATIEADGRDDCVLPLRRGIRPVLRKP